MIEKDTRVLNIWEREILRKVYGPVVDQGIWKTTTNPEPKETHKTPVLVADIKRKVYCPYIFNRYLELLHIYLV
jgi:hypothetical protein